MHNLAVSSETCITSYHAFEVRLAVHQISTSEILFNARYQQVPVSTEGSHVGLFMHSPYRILYCDLPVARAKVQDWCHALPFTGTGHQPGRKILFSADIPLIYLGHRMGELTTSSPALVLDRSIYSYIHLEGLLRNFRQNFSQASTPEFSQRYENNTASKSGQRLAVYQVEHHYTSDIAC